MFVIRGRALHSPESLPKIEMDFEKAIRANHACTGY